MKVYRNLLLLSVLALFSFRGTAQRNYASASVLSTGNWYRISVDREGIYRIDPSFLNTLGITGSIPSTAIRLYGNGGGMLPESAGSRPPDDLVENAIMVVDGGDGQFNGSDYLLFYAQGPHHWQKDSLNKRFRHRKNLYSDKAYYYITIGGTGLRVPTAPPAGPATATVTAFDERYFHELDTVNFLNSGKEWFGEEFSNTPGRTLTRSFSLPFPNVLTGSPGILQTAVAARSINVASSFTISVNNQFAQPLAVPHVGAGLYDYFAQEAARADLFAVSANPTITFSYNPGSFNSQGWLNWFEFFCRRALVASPAAPVFFRDWQSVGSGTAEYVVTGADPSSLVWDLTDPLHPVQMPTTGVGGTLRFVQETGRLHEFAVFSAGTGTPLAEGKVANQNLHGGAETDYILVTYPAFLSAAQALADFHQQRGLRTTVVTTDQVFHEFSGGTPDPTAIRDFVKMHYDRYRANWNSRKYLLLLGKASFDYKNRIANNTNLVPAYESPASIDPLATYTSDDFFGFLDDNEDINSGVAVNRLDIGIGRVPAKNSAEAAQFVEKVMDYHKGSSLGPWRNGLNFIADDEDFNLHLQDAETLTATVATVAPLFNAQKIYLDAFQQEGGQAGGRYPQANAMINSNIFNGTLLWNYSGHGGPPRLAEEVVIDQSIVNSWNNAGRLPLFITATCDFAPFDNPVANSLGENLLVRPKTGAIALMTTTRVVFAFSNRIMNDNYLRFALERDPAGRYKTLGEAVMTAKNYTYQTSGDITNNRKFALLGDPAMTLGFPKNAVRVHTVNGRAIASGADTLSATEMVVMEGEVTDLSGNLLTNFNGRVYLSLFDKQRTITTLGNDPTSTPVPFTDQSAVLFRGKASAQGGRFSFSFRVPKDINYQYGQGKISLYAENGTEDGNGFTNNIIIGSITAGGPADNEGPSIRAYLNDDRFVNGGITNTNPVLLLHLADSSGINTGSSGIDHDIVATLDGDNDTYYILNNFYESELDNYKKGSVRFQLPPLAPGPHTLHIKAWDVMNNSSETVLKFTVIEEGNLRIDHVLNYPNPFTTRTAFWFEHNRPGTDLYAKVEVFSVSGKLVKTLAGTINTAGNRSSELEWDGLDEWGRKLGRGVYIYRLKVRSFDGKTAEKWEKLVIL